MVLPKIGFKITLFCHVELLVTENMPIKKIWSKYTCTCGIKVSPLCYRR